MRPFLQLALAALAVFCLAHSTLASRGAARRPPPLRHFLGMYHGVPRRDWIANQRLGLDENEAASRAAAGAGKTKCDDGSDVTDDFWPGQQLDNFNENDNRTWQQVGSGRQAVEDDDCRLPISALPSSRSLLSRQRQRAIYIFAYR